VFCHAVLHERIPGDFLENQLPCQRGDVPLGVRECMMTHHHILAFSHEMSWATPTVTGGGGGERHCVAPTLTWLESCGFLRVCTLKNPCYSSPVNDVGTFQQRTVNGCRTIRNTTDIFEHVQQSTIRSAPALLTLTSCKCIRELLQSFQGCNSTRKLFRTHVHTNCVCCFDVWNTPP
jgi:hypothetical protein